MGFGFGIPKETRDKWAMQDRIKELEDRLAELENPTPKTFRALCMREGAYHMGDIVNIPVDTVAISDLDGNTRFVSVEMLDEVKKEINKNCCVHGFHVRDWCVKCYGHR